MRKNLLSILIVTCFCLVAEQVRADGILLSWSGRDVQGVTERSSNEARTFTVKQISEKNLIVRTWADAYLLMVAATPRNDDKDLLAALTSQLTNPGTTPLQGTSRLIIWERITSGEILFEGKGYQVSDDLFSVAGRANWMLRNLAKKNFGYVRPNTSADELTTLQQKWTRFFGGEQVEEFKDPYETTEKGLGEIRSLVALEALIVSLAPNEAKDWLTKDCLQRLHKLDELPADPNSPASMCNPDRLTHRYLAVITEVENEHDHDWWRSWWEKNRGELEWKRERGKFVVKH